MLFEFLYFIPDRTATGEIHVHPHDPVEEVVRRMEDPVLTRSELLGSLREDALAIARRVSVDTDPSVPEPSVDEVGDRTMLVSLETEQEEDAIDHLVQLAIDADVALAELTSAGVYLYGDDCSSVMYRTSDMDIPWTSRAALPSLVHRTNPANVWDWVPARDSRFTETGHADEFLTLIRRRHPDEFIQTFLDPRNGAWIVEVGRRSRIVQQRFELEKDVVAVLDRWLTTGGRVTDDYWCPISPDTELPRRDSSGRFIADPQAAWESQDWDDDDDRNDDAPVPEHVP